jgi:hypothetical protein
MQTRHLQTSETKSIRIRSMSADLGSALASAVLQTTVAGVFGAVTTSSTPATITIDVGKADYAFKVSLPQQC